MQACGVASPIGSEPASTKIETKSLYLIGPRPRSTTCSQHHKHREIRSSHTAASGKSSPELLGRHFTDEMRYAANIERALSSWEISPEEWADYIAFLARLLKAIQSSRKDDVVDIPHSRTIAIRLAQCLNPALPSGVHQKALEVYAYIFSTFGNGHVASHIQEYLPGLTAVLSFASLSVRPGLYSLLEDHIVALPPSALRPALKSLILSLLPALEDETGEDFERAFAILRTLERSFTSDVRSIDLSHEQDGYFWQCLFLSVITSPSRRQGALNYLTRTLPKLASEAAGSNESQKAADLIVSPEPGLLVRCFVCGLSDSQLLVQRGFLDILVTHLPLDSMVLQMKVGNDDLDRLVAAAVLVLLRRDMSLNRRLWSWFLGPEPKDQDQAEIRSPASDARRQSSSFSHSDSQLRYFSRHGKASLQRCVLKMLQNPSTHPSQRARPFRICLSLMDRWEIGGLLVSHIFLPAMKCLYEYSLMAPPNDLSEVVRSASLFFDGVEASLIWECLLGILNEAFAQGSDIDAGVQLFRWIIQTFNIKDEEMLTLHIPQAVVYLISTVDASAVSSKVRLVLLDAAILLLDMIPARVLQESQKKSGKITPPTTAWMTSELNAQQAIMDFYRNGEQAAGQSSTAPFENSVIGELLSAKAVAIIEKSLLAQDEELYSASTAVLAALSGKVQLSHELKKPLMAALCNHLVCSDSDRSPFAIVNSTIGLLSALATRKDYIEAADIVALEPTLSAHLWVYMSPELPKYHVEAVRAFWQLEDLLSGDDTIIASLAVLFRDGRGREKREPSIRIDVPEAESVRRLAVLWNHSISPIVSKSGGSVRRGSPMTVLSESKTMQRNLTVLEQPLMLALDILSDSKGSSAAQVTIGWLRSLTTLEQVFRILYRQLKHHLSLLGRLSSHKSPQSSQGLSQRERKSRVRELDHVFSHFESILVNGGAWTWDCLNRASIANETSAGEGESIQFLAETCVKLLCSTAHSSEAMNERLIHILNLLLTGPHADGLNSIDLDVALLERLMACVSGSMSSLQGGLLTLIKLALKLKDSSTGPRSSAEQNEDRVSLSAKRPSIVRSPSPSASPLSIALVPPLQLFKCLQLGFSASSSRFYLEQWLAFLADILPTLTDALFANLLPLVDCFCSELTKAHAQLIATTRKQHVKVTKSPEIVIVSLLEGLEMVLNRAYECLAAESADLPAARESETKPNFLSHMAAGIFKADGPPSRTAQANSRLTVILTFQDAIRVAAKLWLWASNASDVSEFDSSSSLTTAYSAQKVRNRSRHLLEHMFSAEPLESLEAVIAYWSSAATEVEGSAALGLLHVMPVSRPKNVVPAALDALCSRTNLAALPVSRQSSLTMDISSSEIATFLAAYLTSIEDDALDEVWPDCTMFLRDVLSNPLPFRQVLPHLLAVILLLAEKLSNTNFGEQRKMRHDLGDIFQRLLTATFTALPSGYASEPAVSDSSLNGVQGSRHALLSHSMTLLPVLIRIVARIDLILESPDRITATINNITANMISSIFRARSFPKNVGSDILELLTIMSRKAPGAKPWKKEIADAFNDPKLLSSSPEIMAQGWFPALQQWSLHDKDRGLSELLTRLTPPSSAGIMFGVGASAARLEADRRTQFNLRRICILLLASPEDTHVASLRALEEKIAELFDATSSSSPSAVIKAELFILCRTLLVTVSSVHIAPLWPIINAQLQKALWSMQPDRREPGKGEDFSNLALLQGCKLLDVLVGLGLDDFLLHEWLYITDTIDAVYAPDGWQSHALADVVGQALGDDGRDRALPASAGRVGLSLHELAVDKSDIKALPREEFVRAMLRPFLSQLSISAYEGVYGLEKADVGAIRKEVLTDLLELATVVE